MANKETELYNNLTKNLADLKLSVAEISNPDPTVEKEVTNIYTQARIHRDRLVTFYIWYTIVFTLFVFALISAEAILRIIWHNSQFEIVPQWALNLLVTGMFAQFVGLLTIVTKRVWDFKPFLAYHRQMKSGSKVDSEETSDNSQSP